MSRYKLTILTPIHISSGDEYELYYNMLEKDGYVYLYDEFKIVEFFITNNIKVPSNLNELKKTIEQYSDKIINSNLHLRKVKSNFSKMTKPLLAQISTANNPIITGSSIKGSLRTAILDNLYNNGKESELIKKVMKNKNLTKERLTDDKGRVPYDKDFAEIFKYLKITDSLLPLETQIYKTINVKKDKNHQGNREKKVEEIANYVEAIKPNQSFEIEIKDLHEKQIFQNLSMMCNKFYIPFFADDEKQYFTKDTNAVNKAKNANKGMFIINVGRFSGAERKSLNSIRYIKASKANDKSVTSARTFALESSTDDKVYFENSLIPFGWAMCEKLENDDYAFKKSVLSIKEKQAEMRKGKFVALDVLNTQKQKMVEEKEKDIIEQQKAKEEAQRKAQKEKEEREAKLAAMSPLERKIEELKESNPNPNETVDIIIFNALKNRQLDEFRCDALTLLKEEMQKLKKWVEQSKKPEKDKKYKRTQEVIKMLKECN